MPSKLILHPLQPITHGICVAAAREKKGLRKGLAQCSNGDILALCSRTVPDMDVWQRWIFRWRRDWPTKELAGAFERFVRPRSPDPIVGAIQTLLAELGYAPGPADGVMGQRTRAAVREFQQDKGLEVTGEATDELRVAACAELRKRSLHRQAVPGLFSGTGGWRASR